MREQPVHQAPLHLPRRRDHNILRGNPLLDCAQDVGDASLLGEGRERKRKDCELAFA
jgi:hypothetical protein